MHEKYNFWGEYGYFLFAGMIWGSIGIFVKFLEQAGSTPAYTTFLRLSIAGIIMIVYTLIKEGPKAFLVDKKTLLACFLIALVCQFLHNLANNVAVSKIGVGCASVLLYLSPFFTACASVLLFREKITGKKWCILALDILGCALTSGLLRTNAMTDWAGILAGVAAGFSYAMVPVFGKIASGRAKPMVVTTYTYIFSAPMISLLQPWKDVVNPVSPGLLIPGFLYALFPTAIAYALYYTGLEKITEPSRIPVICSVEPVIATILGVILFQEKIYLDTVLGICLVIFSIFLMNRKKKGKPAQE